MQTQPATHVPTTLLFWMLMVRDVWWGSPRTHGSWWLSLNVLSIWPTSAEADSF